MSKRLKKRPLRPVVGEHFTDPRTPETILFGEETTLRPLGNVETVKPVPKKIRRANVILIPDETLFRQQKWKKRIITNITE